MLMNSLIFSAYKLIPFKHISDTEQWVDIIAENIALRSQIAKFIGPTWGPPGSRRPQMGPMLTPWTLLSGMLSHAHTYKFVGGKITEVKIELICLQCERIDERIGQNHSPKASICLFVPICYIILLIFHPRTFSSNPPFLALRPKSHYHEIHLRYSCQFQWGDMSIRYNQYTYWYCICMFCVTRDWSFIPVSVWIIDS